MNRLQDADDVLNRLNEQLKRVMIQQSRDGLASSIAEAKAVLQSSDLETLLFHQRALEKAISMYCIWVSPK